MKVKNNLLFVFAALLSIPSLLFSQSHELDWVVHQGGQGRESGSSIVTDAEGNIYATGYFENTVDFDPGEDTFNLTSEGYFDIFIQKLNSNGQLLWVKSIGSGSRDQGTGITLDSSGNLYITGAFSETVDFDPGEATYNLTTGSGAPYKENIFVLKLDPDGNFIWAKHMAGDSYSTAFSLNTDSNDNVLITGGFSSTVDFDPGEGTVNLTADNGENIFILKLDVNGNFIWVKQMVGDSARGLSIATDTNDNVYTTGLFYETVDFDPGQGTANLTSRGWYDIFVQKLDTNGDLLWVNHMGAETADQGNSLTVDLDGNVYVTGEFSDTVDFDPGAGTKNLTSADLSDIFIQKLDTNGNLLWVKQIGGTHYDNGNAIKTDASGNIYILGNFNGTVDFDPGEGVTNLKGQNFDMFLLKLKSDGSFSWAKNSFGSFTSDSSANGIAIDNNDNIYTIGAFTGEVDFNPLGDAYVLRSQNLYGDIFIQKLRPSSLDLVDNTLLDKFIVHPNPTKGKFSVEFNTIQTAMDVRLFTLSGQLLMEKRFQNIKNMPLEIQHPDGIYLLELKDDQGRKTTVKLVKN